MVAEELGRGLADATFLGPTMEADLCRLAGAPASVSPRTVALTADLSGPATAADGFAPAGAVAVDARGATTSLLLVSVDGGYAIGEVPLGKRRLAST